MKIGEVARKAGVRTSAIRFYEKTGVLPRAVRRNGQRHYAAEAEPQLAVVEFARRAGLTIAEIKLLFHGFRKKRSSFSAMATASPKEVHGDRYSDCLPERYAEAFEKKHAMSLHQIGRLWPHSPVAPRKSLIYLIFYLISGTGSNACPY